MHSHKKKVKAYLDNLPMKHRRFCPAMGSECWCMGCIVDRSITPQDLADYEGDKPLGIHGPKQSQEALDALSARIWKDSKD